MMKDANNLDKVFRGKLENFSSEPPVYLWDNVQENLVSLKRKKRMAWMSWSAVAAMLAVAFISGWYFNETGDINDSQLVQKEEAGSQVEIKSETTENRNPADTKIDSPIQKNVSGLYLAESTSKKTSAKATEIKIADSGQMTEISRFPAIGKVEKIEPLETNLTRSEQEVSYKKLKQNIGEFTSIDKAIVHENTELLATISNTRTGWKMGLNVSPGYSFYSANHGTNYAGDMSPSDAEKTANVGGGLSVQYKTGRRWSVESGIYYARNGQEAGSSTQFLRENPEADYSGITSGERYLNTPVKISGNQLAVNSVAGVIEFDDIPQGAEIAANFETPGSFNGTLLTQGELSQVFDFIEIPIYMRYLLFDSKVDLELVGGFNAGLIVGNNAYLDNEFGVQNIGTTSDISKLNLSGAVGVGLTYEMGKHVSLAVEPRFNYYMNSINRNPEIDFRPYRIGVYTGLYYEF